MKVGIQVKTELSDLVVEWVGWLKAPGSSRKARAETTLKTYQRTIERFNDFLRVEGLPTLVGDIKREHISSYLASCKGAGWRNIAVTNGSRDVAEHLLIRSGLRQHVSVVISCDDLVPDESLARLRPSRSA